MLENGFDPKNPFRAESGEGCADFRTICRRCVYQSLFF
jgi:hypothetical protein